MRARISIGRTLLVFLVVTLACGAALISGQNVAPAEVSATAFCDNVTQIPPAECQALVDLYNMTNGPSWYSEAGWRVTYTPTRTRTPTRTPTPSVIFSDNFNNGLLTGWTASGGIWTNPGTYMRGQDIETTDYLIRNMRSATGGNFVCEGTVNLVRGYSVGLVVRASADGALGYEVALDAVDNQFKLGILSPDFGQLAYAPVTVQFGRAYRIKVVANGSLIEAYLDGAKLLTATDTQYASGQFGVVIRGGWYSQQGIANFDNLEARALP